MKKYHCRHTSTDLIECYIVDYNSTSLFAIVATDDFERKTASALIDYEQAQDLIDQLTDFMRKGAK